MDIGKNGPFKYRPRRAKLSLTDDINGVPILDYIVMLAAYRHTQAEAAALLGCGDSTFRAFLAANEEAQHAWKDGRQMNKASIRRLLYVHAKSDPSTARFLAKNILKMTDSGVAEPVSDPAMKGLENLSRSDARKRILELQRITIVESVPAQSLVPT